MTVDSTKQGWTVNPVGRIAAPLREQVTNELRRAILDFELKPGQRLIERELIEKLGVSRATVREALRELGSEGLVIVEPQRGALVAVPTRAEAIEMYEIRAVLESMLVQHFVERATDDQVARLQAAVEVLGTVTVDNDDVRTLLAGKDEFYSVLHEGAACPTLSQILDGLKARVRVLRATSLSTPGRSQQVLDELREIVAAVAERDSERAASLCAAHIRMAAHTALSGLESRFGQAP